MKKQIGVWIDRRQAILVSLTDTEETVKTLTSEVEKHVPTTGGAVESVPYGSKEIVAGDRVERRAEHHLDKYYADVLAELSDAEEIALFGPGLAKAEMKKRLKKSKALSRNLKAVETADKMTETQFRAKIKDFFKWNPPEEL